MSLIKVISPQAQNFQVAVAQLIKRSSRGIIGNDRSILEKRAGADIMRELNNIKVGADQTLIHLIAIGATEDYGANRNGDGFSRATCERHHPSFMKYAKFYRDHKNKDETKSFGQVKLSAWHDPMKRIELIVALNNTKEAAERNHGLVADRELEKLASGKDIPVSMACRVPYDVCSWCMNKAASRADYCTSDSCEAGGLMHNIGQIVEMTKQGKHELHHLHADNPDPVFFDISHVIRPADRIAYVTGQLEKAAGVGRISGAELAEALGVTVPYDLLASQRLGIWTGRNADAMQRMAKYAYMLADTEAELEAGQLSEARYAAAFTAGVQAELDTPPRLYREKFAGTLRALTDARICLPLSHFVALTTEQDFTKAAETAAVVGLCLPGVFNRLISSQQFADKLASNPFVPAPACDPRFREWAVKQAADLSLSEPSIQRRLTLAALRGEDNLSVRRGQASEKTAGAKPSAAEHLAENYALYKLAFLASLPEGDRELGLTATMVVLQNYAN